FLPTSCADQIQRSPTCSSGRATGRRKPSARSATGPRVPTTGEPTGNCAHADSAGPQATASAARMRDARCAPAATAAGTCASLTRPAAERSLLAFAIRMHVGRLFGVVARHRLEQRLGRGQCGLLLRLALLLDAPRPVERETGARRDQAS